MYAIAFLSPNGWQTDYNNQYECKDSAERDVEQYKLNSGNYLNNAAIKVVEL